MGNVDILSAFPTNKLFVLNSEIKRYLIIWSGLWVMVAVFAFIQDYISASLNDTSFVLFESLAYKFFWLLFIPFAYAHLIGLKKIKESIHGSISYLMIGLLILVTSLFHLLIFSLFLLFISQLIHQTPWELSIIIIEKLSSRLYIVVIIYLLMTAVSARWDLITSFQKDESKTYPDIVPIRVGKKTITLSPENIMWVQANSGFISLYTEERKYVFVNSLKNLMEKLNPDQFKRIHRSTIVNINCIKQLKSRLNGDYDVITKDGTILRLSRNYSASVKGILL